MEVPSRKNLHVEEDRENTSHEIATTSASILSQPNSPQPTPAPSRSSNDMALRIQILALTEQLELLESITKGDSCIGISGISNLRNPENSNSWEDRIYGLLFDSEIPLPWFLEIIPTEIDNNSETNDIETAYIYFINEATKNESKKRINRCIQTKYFNRVVLV